MTGRLVEYDLPLVLFFDQKELPAAFYHRSYRDPGTRRAHVGRLLLRMNWAMRATPSSID
jgi:hypothetical protein